MNRIYARSVISPTWFNFSTPSTNATPHSSAFMSATAKCKKILFVDDSTDFLDIFSQAMEISSKGEWEVYTAHNAAKALEMLEQNPGVNLAVIDSQMPLVDGLQLLRLLSRKYTNLPKAILTGFPNESDRQACLNNGADLYLHKPTTSDEMQTIF